jgi:hypothetical protein
MINLTTNYHWVWYTLGFLFAPRITLAVIASVYLPIALGWKILIWFIAIVGGSSKGTE